MAVDAMPPGPIRLPDAATPMGLFINNMADTKNSRTAAAFFVPHQHFSNAKVNILSETSKQFT